MRKTILIVDDSASLRVVFGMPKEAIKLGGVDKIMSLESIVKEIIKIK